MHTAKHLRDLHIITLAAQGTPLSHIAQHLHIHRNTVTKRLKRPEVRQLVDTLLEESLQHASAQMVERLEGARQAREKEKVRRKALGKLHAQRSPAQRINDEALGERAKERHQALALLKGGPGNVGTSEIGTTPAPDTAMAETQARDWRARLEELKRMPV